jgi:hypothetical protein
MEPFFAELLRLLPCSLAWEDGEPATAIASGEVERAEEPLPELESGGMAFAEL